MIQRALLWVVFLGLIFIALNRLLGLSERRIETALSYATYPLLRINAALQNRFCNRSQIPVTQVLQDLEKITHERDALLQELVTLKALKRTVQDTQELRDFGKCYQTKGALVVPILLRNFSGHHFFLVDGGERSGIEQDMVALYKNTIVGKVVQVYPSYSKVLLITDPQCYVSVATSSQGTRGMHHGFKKGFTTLDYVDPQEEVLVGDMILSTGEGGLFPRGFALGTVTQVDEGGYGRSIVVEPLIDLKIIAYCTIVPHSVILLASDQEEPPKLPASS
jgi:rod shape-determining protein MreC